MIRQIKNYLMKYHEANLWIAERSILEEKRKALESVTTADIQAQMTIQPVSEYTQTVFSRYDMGHNEEEKNKIQQLYNELEDLVRIPTLAI